ncbi:MAG: hypothetical protein COU69_01365 [Candidatus Pacebacteria bacterium CG10_big_fil_rev_8_21_14_0_10_56_10]|nr:MAG: hypothetical protein COU69_01365 [Candidatus Pacebacteria bacterium CG10_big_fil_rev_8_21_14_0_10_56_10]
MTEYSYKSAAELARKTGLTLEEAGSAWKSWNYQPPTDPEELRRFTNKSSRFEHGVRGLNQDLSTGRITEDEYFQKIAELKKEIYGQS